MNLTPEQQDVVDYALSVTTDELLLIDSVAGSGKTTLLRALSEALAPSKGMYLAYNKAIATSSKKKFPKAVDCRTTHSLAYKAVVVPNDLNVGFLGVNQITDKISYTDKYLLVEDIREFCLSKYLTYEEYAKANKRHNIALANKYLKLMETDVIDCTHDFYLKLFHQKLAAGKINFPKQDLLMLDEAGDLNQVTLEIFRLIPAKVKVAVGDPHQNIYTFNYTINCFDELVNEGKTFKLSKSFRVPEHIAEPMEKFCKTYLNPDMEFKGTTATEDDVRTRAYISRTNAGLINRMIELNQDGTPYALVRKAAEIFKLPLMVASFKYQGSIYDPAYKHLQNDIDDFHENANNIRATYKTLHGYLKSKYDEDLGLMQALSLVTKHEKKGIFEAYTEAKKHEGKKQNFMLLTAHSAKGLEFDEVSLAPDMNLSIEPLVTQIKANPKTHLNASDKESLNLYYVACTRALIRLRNATHLTGL